MRVRQVCGRTMTQVSFATRKRPLHLKDTRRLIAKSGKDRIVSKINDLKERLPCMRRNPRGTSVGDIVRRLLLPQ